MNKKYYVKMGVISIIFIIGLILLSVIYHFKFNKLNILKDKIELDYDISTINDEYNNKQEIVSLDKNTELVINFENNDINNALIINTQDIEYYTLFEFIPNVDKPIKYTINNKDKIYIIENDKFKVLIGNAIKEYNVDNLENEYKDIYIKYKDIDKEYIKGVLDTYKKRENNMKKN